MELPSFTWIENFLAYIIAWLQEVIAVLKNNTITQKFNFENTADEDDAAVEGE